jgi:regulator of sigma E protease
MTIIIFILVLLVCVIVHEWGHFFAARKSGMLVEEFGFGIPPRIWGKKKGETLYSINALPIGGFVKIAGENGIEAGVPVERQFDSKPWYLKAIVLVAGVTMNIILAIVLFTFAYELGMPTVIPGGTPTIVSVSPDSPAGRAGIAVGDTVQSVSIDGTPAATLSTDELRSRVAPGAKSVVILYTHDGIPQEVTLVPTGEDGARMIGLAVEPIGTASASFGEAIKIAWHQVWAMVATVWHTLGQLVSGLLGGAKGSLSGLIGPVGLAGEVKSAASISFAYLLAFTAAISVNLAVLNIMPFPALDGGRLLVVLLEAITRKKFSRTVVGAIHAIGFLLLLALLVLLTIGDIRKL